MQDVTKTDGRFLPGVSGNPAGRPAGSKNIQRQLEDAVRSYIAHPTRVERIKKVLDRLLQKAEDGNVAAAKLLLDKIIQNAKEDTDPGAGGGTTYVFRIENATFAGQKPQTAAIEVVDVTPQETK